MYICAKLSETIRQLRGNQFFTIGKCSTNLISIPIDIARQVLTHANS
jgi:hypothetical protein